MFASNSMTQDYQIMPSLEHCSSMVSLFGRSGLQGS
ncbi:unnamed protein product [Rhodiola kirilowii]